MSGPWEDRYGGVWVPTEEDPSYPANWFRLDDGTRLQVTLAGVEIVWHGNLDHNAMAWTNDPQGWLTTHLGAPDLGLPDPFPILGVGRDDGSPLA